MKIIEANSISKTVTNGNNKYEILHENTFVINQGEFVAIMGPSGSGKSTLLGILGGLDSNYSGKLYFDGKPMHDLAERELLKFRRKNISTIFQDFNIINTLSVQENLILPLLFMRKKSYEMEKIKYLLNEVGMYKKREESCLYLSGGEKQRVAIARALMINPKLVLADEPTGALDSNNSINVMELLKKFNEKDKTTIVLVTHDDNMASYGNRRIFIKDGHIKESSKINVPV